MNRRTFDQLVPGVYAILVVVTFLTVGGQAAVVVTVVGAIVVGLYYSAIRRNLPTGRDTSTPVATPRPPSITPPPPPRS